MLRKILKLVAQCIQIFKGGHFMSEKRNFNNTQDYNNNNITAIPVVFNWKQPSQMVQWMLQFIRNPVSAVRRVVSSGDISQPLAMVFINLISVFIASVICVIILNIRYSLYFSWLHIPSAGIIIFSLLLAAIFDFGFPGLLFVSTGIIFKEKTSFYKMLSITGGKVITDSLFLLAGSAFMLLGSFFFFLFAIAGNIISFAIIITIYNEEISLPQTRKIYSISIPLIIISIIIIIILKIFTSLLAGNIFSYINLF